MDGASMLIRRRVLSTGATAFALVAASALVWASSSSAEPSRDRGVGVVDPQAGPPWEGDSFAGLHGVVESGGAAALAGPGGPKDPDADTVDLGALSAGAAAAIGEERVDVPGEGGVAGLAEGDGPTTIPAPVGRGATADELRAALAGDERVGDLAAASTPGTVRLIVYMNQDILTEGQLTADAIAEQRASIADTLAQLDGVLAHTGSAVVDRYHVIPAAVVEADAAGLDALLASSAVASITLDFEGGLALDVSTGVIDSDLLNAAGVLGNGYDGGAGGPYEIVVLDSGVRSTHEAFGSRVVDGFCYSNNSDCPSGGTSQFGIAAGAACTYTLPDCEHGTHVAGIAAGASWVGGTGGHEGVASGARIVSGQIGNDTPLGWRWTLSNLENGLQRAINLVQGPRPNIVAVNMSLWGPNHTTEAACEASSPSTEALMVQLDSLQVAPVAASGNDASTTMVTFPSCLPSVYTIASTDDADSPSGFSNRNDIVDFWAPGSDIVAPISTSDIAKGSKSGTSMAAPHVAGAFALLRECIPISTDESVASRLSTTGVDITSPAGVTRKRINVLDAATSTVNNNDFSSPEVFNGDGPFDDYDWNVCADSEPGEPTAAPLFGNTENSVWWTWTPATSGIATISTNDGSGNVTTFDTVLHVFQGDSLGSLTLLAYDDDSGVDLRSLVTMLVNAGETYRIRVDGFQAENGELNLHIENNVAECRGVPATIVGTTGDDVIDGTPGDDVIVTGAGDDTVNGLGGNDRICGGAGNDVLRGSNGVDVVDGESGDDVLFGGPDGDTVYGGPGADEVFGGLGADLLVGNAGFGDANDVGDVINGGDGDDVIDGWVGDDVLRGGPGNDELYGGAGTDTTEYLTASGSVTVDLAAGTASGAAGDDTIWRDIENVIGSPFADVLRGDAGANRIDGAGGDDLILGRSGPDELRGSGGDDTLDGAFGFDVLIGGFGRDLLRGGPGDDVLFGGLGVDEVTFSDSSSPVDVDLAAGTATGQGNDTLTSIANLTGSLHADVLRGDTGPNRIRGLSGDDLLIGSSGADTIVGDGGNDVIRGGNGPDLLLGGLGNDNIRGGNGEDAIRGSSGDDVISGDGHDDDINGQGGDDVIQGGPGDDTISGSFGEDRLFGQQGNDRLFGNDQSDLLRGGDGDDVLRGGPAFDRCHGMAGIDTAVGCEAVTGVP